MNDASEAEMSAAITAVQETFLEVGIQLDVLARAALTAAAQVRPNAEAWRLSDLLSKHGLHGEAISNICAEFYGAAQVRERAPNIRPIHAGSDVQDQCDEMVRRVYAPTEPDQGEDKLGMRKGEGS